MWTLFGIIAFNVIFGDGSPLLWGMLNTIQIIYYFPLLSFYYPPRLSKFLEYLKVSDLEIDVPLKIEYL